MDLIKQYIIALTNLYGQVPADIVVDVYNGQNKDQLNIEDLEVYFYEDLSRQHVYALVAVGRNTRSVVWVNNYKIASVKQLTFLLRWGVRIFGELGVCLGWTSYKYEGGGHPTTLNLL